MGETICYTGVGSKKSGNHTKKQFLNTMNKHFKNECLNNTKSLKCESCNKLRKTMRSVIKKVIKAEKKNKTYKVSDKKSKKVNQYAKLCKKCRKKNTSCNVEQYIEFSGAFKGQCKKNNKTKKKSKK
jgi:hypothetical protein